MIIFGIIFKLSSLQFEFFLLSSKSLGPICALLRKLRNLPLAFLKEIVGDSEEACDFVKRAFLEQMSSQNFQLHFISQAKT